MRKALLDYKGLAFPDAGRRLRRGHAGRFLTISVSATFAAAWLVRRLRQFTESFPDIDVRLQTTDRLAKPGWGGVPI